MATHGGGSGGRYDINDYAPHPYPNQRSMSMAEPELADQIKAMVSVLPIYHVSWENTKATWTLRSEMQDMRLCMEIPNISYNFSNDVFDTLSPDVAAQKE